MRVVNEMMTTGGPKGSIAPESCTPGGSDRGLGVHVGVDLASVDEVARSIHTLGDRYLTRIFTAAEIAACAGDPGPRAACFAARFAAKEATMKLLAPDDDVPDLRTIEVERLASGACAIHLTGTAAELAARAGLGPLALSMSHEGNVAVAVVLGLGTPRS